MNVHFFDWAIIALMLLLVLFTAGYGMKYMRGVAGFLAAERLAGRYLLTVSSHFYGAISLVAIWEMVYVGGLPTQWWGMMNLPVGLFLALTGFITYRYRQTRCLTLAQFFEIRYSRRFRYFAGALCWLSGMLNYGIFPAVTTRIIMVFLNLPDYFNCFGFEISTFATVMAGYLAIAVWIACCGGQISIMLTDFVQGSLLMIIFVIIILFLLWNFSWHDITIGLTYGVSEGKSMIDPLKDSASADFDLSYFIIGLLAAIYNVRSWQGASGYSAAAKTPHEAVISGVVSTWRLLASTMCLLLIPLIAYAVLHSPDFAGLGAPIQQQIDTIADPVIRQQMTVPVFLRNILPVGLFGLFAAVIIGSAIGCDDTYLHSWGSIFVQDVLLPVCGRKPSPELHLKLLRVSIIAVALFGYFFSMFFELKNFILMFFALTGAIYLGGAGAVIIGGLYWRRGTTAGAWCAMITGTVIGFGGILIEQQWHNLLPRLTRYFPDVAFPEKFPVNGQWIYFIAMASASAIYIIVSLLARRQNLYNLDRLLHRGAYAETPETVSAAARGNMGKFNRLIGITAEFTRSERWLFYATFGWTVFWWSVFALGTLAGSLWDIPETAWSFFWCFYIWLGTVIGTICTVWIFQGGLQDAWRLFRDLDARENSAADNGIVNHQPASEDDPS